MDGVLLPLTLLAALGAGTMGGFFYAFSGLLMPSLGRIAAPAAIAAMQTINVVVLNPLFLLLFFGTGGVSLVIIALGLAGFGGAGAWLAVAGAVIYLATIIGVTALFNVPMNTALARVDAHSAEGATLWADYLRRWTRWNHVRSAGGMASLACLLASLVSG